MLPGRSAVGPVVVLLSTLSACSRGSSESAPSEAGARTLIERAAAAACAGKPGCTAPQVLPAGKDSAGRSLAVVLVLLGDPDAGACVPRESWLVAVPDTGQAQRTRLISAGTRCDFRDDPAVEVLGPGRVQYDDNENTPLRWRNGGMSGSTTFNVTRAYELTLDPLTIVHVTESRDGWPGGLRALLGEPPAAPTCTMSIPGGEALCSSIVTVPRVQVTDGAAFAADGWKTTSLGDCAALVDSAHGWPEPVGAGTSSFRALFTDDALYVEVIDDTFVTKGTKVDALSMRLATGDGKPGGQIWRMTMDGAVKSFWLNSPGEHWSRADVAIVDARTRRFRVKRTWGDWANNAEILYEDTSDGVSLRQTLHASQYEEPILPFDPAVVDCVAEGGTLRVRRKDAVPDAGSVAPFLP